MKYFIEFQIDAILNFKTFINDIILLKDNEFLILNRYSKFNIHYLNNLRLLYFHLNFKKNDRKIAIFLL